MIHFNIKYSEISLPRSLDVDEFGYILEIKYTHLCLHYTLVVTEQEDEKKVHYLFIITASWNNHQHLGPFISFFSFYVYQTADKKLF